MLVILPIIMHVIPNFCPFRSSSYGFQDKHCFFHFLKIFKFKKIEIFPILVILPIIMHVIPNFLPIRSSSYGFRDKHFFICSIFFNFLNCKQLKKIEIFKTLVLPIIMHMIPNFRPFRSISYGFQEKHVFL